LHCLAYTGAAVLSSTAAVAAYRFSLMP